MCADDPDADDLGLGGLPAQGNAALAPLTGVGGRAKRALRNYLGCGGRDWNTYAVHNGLACTPGTTFKGPDGRRHLCQ